MSPETHGEFTLPWHFHPPRLLLRVKEAAEALAIGRTALYELIRAGELPVLHLGRSARIPFAALEAYVKRRTEQHDELD